MLSFSVSGHFSIKTSFPFPGPYHLIVRARKEKRLDREILRHLLSQTGRHRISFIRTVDDSMPEVLTSQRKYLGNVMRPHNELWAHRFHGTFPDGQDSCGT